jgi:hypothetical protein
MAYEERPMIDHLDRDADDAQARAAVVIGQFTPDDVPGYRLRYAVNAARALDEAGLLASPERDAAVAAKALREAEGDYSHLYQTRGPAATAVAAVTCAALRDRADRIEREAGELDADA